MRCLPGMRTPQILLREHLPYVMPIIFFTTMNNLIWAIGTRGDALGPRLLRHQPADHRRA